MDIEYSFTISPADRPDEVIASCSSYDLGQLCRRAFYRGMSAATNVRKPVKLRWSAPGRSHTQVLADIEALGLKPVTGAEFHSII
jgi:hypothetical protein